jgi:hypothetical protein
VASIGHAGSTRKIRVHLPAPLENISRLPRANDAEQTFCNHCEGVWAAYPITFGAMFILQMSYYMLVWRKRAVRRLI